MRGLDDSLTWQYQRKTFENEVQHYLMACLGLDAGTADERREMLQSAVHGFQAWKGSAYPVVSPDKFRKYLQTAPPGLDASPAAWQGQKEMLAVWLGTDFVDGMRVAVICENFYRIIFYEFKLLCGLHDIYF